jgi:hypothetical protein
MKNPITIRSVSYAEVSISRTNKQYWAITMNGKSLPKESIQRLEAFIHRCFQGKDDLYKPVKFDSVRGVPLKKKMAKMQSLGLLDNEPARKDLMKEIADSLCQEMGVLNKGKAGILFAIDCLIEGNLYNTIIKLDAEKKTIIGLRNAAGNHELFVEHFDQVLPEGDSELRKALIIPSPDGSDAKSSQYDFESDYWSRFVGASQFLEAKKISKALFDVVNSALKSENREVTALQMITILDEIEALSDRTADAVATKIKTVTKAAKSIPKIAALVDASIPSLSLTKLKQPSKINYSFGHGLKMDVSPELVKDGTVTVRDKGDEIHIRIKEGLLREHVKFE